jgi:drug/metabolite transporter (DMT)-like permease
MKTTCNSLSYTSAVLTVLAAALGWAALGTWVLLLPSHVHALAFSGVRGAIIALSFLWIQRRSVKREPAPATGTRQRDWRHSAGLAYAFSSISYVASLGLIPVGVAAPLHYTAPLFLLCGRALIRREIPRIAEGLGAALSGLGIVVLVLQSEASAALGVAVAILSAAFWALYIASQDRLSLPDKHGAALVGGVVMCGFSLPWYHTGLCAPHIAGLLLLAGLISSTLPLLLLARASGSLPPSSISLLLLSEPAMAATLAYLCHGQTLPTMKLIGLTLITAGAVAPIADRLSHKANTGTS